MAMYSIENIHNIPDNHTVDFTTSEISNDQSYYFRKLYLPAALIRLSIGKNFVGEGSIHVTGRGVLGYHEARDYFHGSPDSDQTLRSLQGQSEDQNHAAAAFGFTDELPNIAQVVGLQIDPLQVTNHHHGKYYTVESTHVPIRAIDSCSRIGLYRLLGEPSSLDWFVEDIDPDIETTLQLHHIDLQR